MRSTTRPVVGNTTTLKISLALCNPHFEANYLKAGGRLVLTTGVDKTPVIKNIMSSSVCYNVWLLHYSNFVKQCNFNRSGQEHGFAVLVEVHIQSKFNFKTGKNW